MKFIILILLTLSSINSWSQVKPSKFKMLSSNFTFNYTYQSVFINHIETSDTAGFVALNGETNIFKHIIDIGYEKEFFTTAPVSITFCVFLGLNAGSKEEKGQSATESLNSLDSIQGQRSGAGVYLNYNIFKAQHRYQPFISMKSIQEKNKYFLRYDDAGYDGNIEIEYDRIYAVIEYAAGIRIYNYNNKMMSTIAVQISSAEDTSTDVTAAQGDTSFEISNIADFKRDSASLLLGFGVLF